MNKLSMAAMQKKMRSKGTTPIMKKKLNSVLNARKWKMSKGGLVEFGYGGMMAGVGTLLGGPVGGTIGGLAGAGLDMYMENKQQGDAEAEALKLRGQSIQANQIAMNNSGTGNMPTFPYGGMVSGQPNVEVEKEEVSQGPDGSMMKFNLPSHAKATRANQMAMEPGTRIFSDKLKAQSGKTIAEEADRLRKEIQRYEQILNS
jgi:hypothetical protein